MTLRNEKIDSEIRRTPPIKTQPHLTISGLEFQEGEITAHLSDSRSVIVPVAWFPRLRNATLEQLKNYEISPAGCAIHWEDLDEDISIKNFLNGLKGGCCH